MKFLTTDIEKLKYTRHGFFMRLGGTSGGVYDSLNCAFSSNDKPDNVRANRAMVAEALDLQPDGVLTLKQIHSAKVIKVDKPWTREQSPEADAMVTDQRGIGLGVLTADCAPVLFAAKKGRVVGAAHAGWKGAVSGVIGETVRAMGDFGVAPENIVASIGPCIGPQSYEVSEGFEKPFLAQDTGNDKFFRKGNPGHLIFDLPGYITLQLKNAGVGAIYDTRQDTLANEGVFFSYRRTTQRKEGDYGRQISVIAIS